MTEVPNTYRYMNELRQLQDLIKNYPRTSNGKGCEYSIYYVLPKDTNWKQVEWKNADYKRFVKRSEEIIQLFEPDALKVELHIKNKKQDHIIRLIPDKHIPVIDGTSSKTLDRRQQRQADIQQNEQHFEQNQGLGTVEFKSDSGLGALQMQNLQKDFDLKLLQRDLDQLKKDNGKLEIENKELTEALYEYENKADKGKLENLGLLIGAGKLLKMDNQSLLGLAGMLMGGGEQDTHMLAESLETEKKGDGLDLSGVNNERVESIQVITQFLNKLEDENFRKVISLLQFIEKRNDLVDGLLKSVLLNSQENIISTN